MKRIEIDERELSGARDRARREMISRRLPALFAEVDPGRWGQTETGLALLTAIEGALAVADTVGRHLGAAVAGPAGDAPEEGPFPRRRPLAPEERLFVHLFAAWAAAVEGGAATAALLDAPVRIGSPFALEEVRRLLGGDQPALPARLLADLLGYVDFQRRLADPARRVDSAARLARCCHAYFALLRRTAEELATDPGIGHLCEALAELPVTVAGRRFRAFREEDDGRDRATGLLDVTVGEVVGNRDYLEAALRTARDVAGFDLTAGRNPKNINPILFALGRPGCGKTVTAHAVGRYFLDYCRQRDLPARFLVIRRTDWASSYQNASAASLVRIFTEEVAGFDGVVGVYWPDIDTAFAARDDPGVRAEERNILGACFGVFDGTLLPHDGKWFMLCDANVLEMDEATVSRITQEPFLIAGATTPEEVVRLLRDVKLGRHGEHLALSEDEWLRLARRCRELDLSGRTLAAVARRVIAAIEDFEYPDEYFRADLARRREIIAERSRTLDAAAVLALVERYGAFEQEAAERASRERFDRRVREIVLNLSAQSAALGELGRESDPS